jgi:ketosteroid isomerase-like protein
MKTTSPTRNRITAGRNLLLTLAVLAVAFPAHAKSSAPVADSAARNAAIVREAFDGWANKGGNIFDLLSPDIRWTIHGTSSVAGTYTGVEDFVKLGAVPLVSRLATPLQPVLHDIWADGDRVVIRFDATATTTSGAPYENQYVWIFRMKNGAVVEAEAFLDLVAYQRVVENNEPKQP